MKIRSLALGLSYMIAVCGVGHLAADDWPQWRGPARDGTWSEQGILEKFPAGGPPVRWRAPVGPGYSGPAVAGGRVFVLDRVPSEPGAEVKVAWNTRNKSADKERVICLEESTGKVLWTHEYPCEYSCAYGIGPRSTPTVHGDYVYTLGAMGAFFCLEAATGRVVWQKDFVKDFGAEVPLYGFAGQPLVDGDRLVTLVGAKERTISAFDRTTGKEVWKALSASEPGYCAPMIFKLAGLRQMVVWHGDGLSGLEPETGRELWSVPVPNRVGMAIATPAVEGNRLTSPILLFGGHVYGVSLYGDFCCLNGETGDRVWVTQQPTTGGAQSRDRWSSLFMVTGSPAWNRKPAGNSGRFPCRTGLAWQ